MSITRIFALGVIFVCLNGCAAFSTVNMGPMNSDKVREGDSVSSAIAAHGSPTFVYETERGGKSVYVWRHTKSMGIMGFYTMVQKKDLAVEVTDDVITKTHWADVGSGTSILGILRVLTEEMP